MKRSIWKYSMSPALARLIRFYCENNFQLVRVLHTFEALRFERELPRRYGNSISRQVDNYLRTKRESWLLGSVIQEQGRLTLLALLLLGMPFFWCARRLAHLKPESAQQPHEAHHD